jgi:aminopeptidase
MMDKEILKKYAELIVKVGANIQKGQDVMLYCSFDQPDFIRMLVEEFYLYGARKVFLNWEDQKLTKLDLTYQNLESLSKVESFEEEKLKYIVDHTPIRCFIESEDPGGLVGIDEKKMMKARLARFSIIKKYREKFEDACQWVIAGVPGLGWAKKVFPESSDEEAVEKLWVAILKASRTLEGDPIENRKKHDEKLREKTMMLNSLKLSKLHYFSKNGTDLWIGLNDGVKRLSGGEKAKNSGIYFQPNIPTEECFTSPKRGDAQGIVYASKPLSYNGNLIEDFRLKFKDGRVVESHARIGDKILRSIYETDEGSHYLGECALIPFHSPISDMNMIFYSTLYDENASCHLALGAGFNMLFEGYENLTPDELFAKGINRSSVHVDFMIGSDDMNIDGYDNSGEVHRIFTNGDWAR